MTPEELREKIQNLEEGASDLITAIEAEIKKGPIHVDRAAEILADLKKTDAIMQSWEANLQPHCFGTKWHEARDKIKEGASGFEKMRQDSINPPDYSQN